MPPPARTDVSIVAIGLVVVVGAGIGFFLVARRRPAPEPPPPPPELPDPAKLVWIPTAPRRRRPDSYGALAPGALEDRARRP
jgi:hypothetical protein